jgi:hypothetical protein
MDPAALRARVRQHQAGLLLDTNVLLLFLADAVSTDFARRWKRTDWFAEEHVAVMQAATSEAKRFITTPHVLTEATNLAGGGAAHDEERKRLNELLRSFASSADERYPAARVVAADAAFSRLGLADLAHAFHRRRARPLVLTDDAPLTKELEGRGLPVANLSHYAFPASLYQ